LPVATAYDYLVPEGAVFTPGDIVEVPLARRFEVGVVWGASHGDVPPGKLREVIHKLDLPPLPDVLLKFIDWVAGYTLQPAGAVLRMTLNPARRWPQQKAATAIVATGKSLADCGIKFTPGRAAVLNAATSAFASAAALSREAKVGTGVVRDLVAAGALSVVEAVAISSKPAPNPGHHEPKLEPAQERAASALAARIDRGFSVTLLDGVTGSGKTEVYLEAVAAALKAGRQVLVLVPEIALTTQGLARFLQRFGVLPAEWHSDLTYKARRETWHGAATGAAQVVVGARSALFLPFSNLGLIVVDEEHDSAFKQEDGVIYHARDMAVVRAREGNIPIILASATPSLETIVNVRNKRYGIVHLPERFASATMPRIGITDMRAHPPEKGRWGRAWLAPPLVRAIDQTLAAGEQVLLFLNRRGYAPLTLCRGCGHRLNCPRCTAWLVEHRLTHKLQCHHCGYGARVPATCSSCGAADSFVPCGPGIERVAEEAAARWPQANVRAVSSDVLERPSSVAELIADILARRIDILVGTQVLAKGHHFPSLTVVGVVDADLGLSGWDLRAAERTHQLLHQVAGRAGRADKPGRVYLQTHDPAHPVMQALLSGDEASFIASEIAARQSLAMPPFGRLAALILSGPDETAVIAAGRTLAAAAPRGDDVEVLGPAPAFMALLRGRHRHRLLLKTERDTPLQGLVQDWLARVKLPSSVRIQVDIDPYSFF
ncbi:MAG: primosomal protein N', partial [Rhodospirillaceae bacterium]|nr:primosomal protein N' [Rhodospirillaceae bacterium]